MKMKFCVAAAALAAVCLYANGASAATISIAGLSYPTVESFPGYGPGVNQHNVVNSGTSGLTDPLGDGSLWRTSDGVTAAGVSFSAGGLFQVDYYHIGGESGNTNRLSVGGTTPFTHDESNQNNNHTGGNNPGPYYIGSTIQTAGPGNFLVDFSVTDLDEAGTTANGDSAKPGASIPSLMYAYVTRTAADSWVLSAVPTNWFAFGFDDPGSSNDNHDDYVGIAHVRVSNGEFQPVPIPAPLALLLTGLLGLGFLGRWKAKLAA